MKPKPAWSERRYDKESVGVSVLFQVLMEHKDLRGDETNLRSLAIVSLLGPAEISTPEDKGENFWGPRLTLNLPAPGD
jgi:hypothetical protein